MSRKDLANAIRMLTVDAVQKANSGHPGAPMGMADMAEVLWNDFLNHNPNNPSWSNRDRFVLSNGHASMMLYSLLHLTGYNVSIDDLKQFRQLHAKTAGHPEYGYIDGIETTTGPLGQGLSNAVGMAIAEKTLAAQFNRDNFNVVDHHTYVFLGDGCLMEGISHEACSLAGTLKLGKLIVLYDDNNISIDGNVDGWFTDDTQKRFEAYGWHVVAGVDGHNSTQISNAITEAKANTDKPSIIICKTTIGYGSPNKAGTHNSHGAPLGNDEIELVRKELNWPYAPFEVPEDVYQGWDAKAKGNKIEQEWNSMYAEYKKAYPDLALEFERRLDKVLPSDWQKVSDDFIKNLQANPTSLATRKSSQNAIEAYGHALPEFLGGSADLAGSNLTMYSGSKPIIKDQAGNYINYGVREFAMCAIMNGIALHKGFIPYGGTFLVFMEYAHNAIRMAALMKQRIIYVFTHDSIGVGEDGPTHQPVEQTSTLRLIPNLNTWRPCDQVEAAVAWKVGIETMDKPTALILTRQNLTQMDRTSEQLSAISKGAYILVDSEGVPDLIIIATGSEVELAVKSAAELTAQGKKVRVVSMPCTEIFDAQDEAYKESVLPKSVTKRIAIEAAIGDYWYKYVGLNGAIIAMTGFGESAPAGLLFKEFGFTVENVVSKANSLF